MRTHSTNNHLKISTHSQIMPIEHFKHSILTAAADEFWYLLLQTTILKWKAQTNGFKCWLRRLWNEMAKTEGENYGVKQFSCKNENHRMKIVCGIHSVYYCCRSLSLSLLAFHSYSYSFRIIVCCYRLFAVCLCISARNFLSMLY